MPTKAVLDWIEGSNDDFTESPEILIKLAASICDLHPDGWRLAKGFNRYKLCVRHISGVQVLSGTKGNGLHVIASGQAISALAEMGTSSMDFIGRFGRYSIQPTRYDLALDCINMGLNPSVLYKEFNAGRAESKARTPYLIRSGQGGLTLYIGAQQSDRHIRMYNKEAEIKRKAKVPEGIKDWIRIEITLMREFARYGHDTITTSGLDVAVRSHIKEYCNFPTDRRFMRAVTGETVAIGTSTRTITDTQAWLLSTVAKTVARESLADDRFYERFLKRIQTEIDILDE